MNKGLTKDVWLYFNNEADNDNIATSTNGCWPAKNLVNMAPTGDSLLSLYFKSMINAETNGGAEEVVHDVVTLTLTTANTHLAAMTAITQAINGTRPNFGGFIDVADDHTVIVGGSAGSRTAATGITFPGASVLANAGISACATIATSAANTGVHTSTITATDAGTGTGTIPGGGFYTVGADSDADHIVILPSPVPGTVVRLGTQADSTGFELRSSAPATVKINGGSGSNAEAAIGTAATLVECVCVNATNWFCTFADADGDIAKTEAAA